MGPELSEKGKKLFNGIKYIISGEISDEVTCMLSSNGAERYYYISDHVTHCIVGLDSCESDIEEAEVVYEIPAVTQEWVSYSFKCNKLLPTSAFKASGNKLFTGVVASFSKVSVEDHKKLWAMLKYYGGTYTSKLKRDTTHLILGKPEGRKYDLCLTLMSSIRVVTPDWLVDSIKAGTLLDVDSYHPRLLIIETPLPTNESLIAEKEPWKATVSNSNIFPPALLPQESTEHQLPQTSPEDQALLGSKSNSIHSNSQQLQVEDFNSPQRTRAKVLQGLHDNQIMIDSEKIQYQTVTCEKVLLKDSLQTSHITKKDNAAKKNIKKMCKTDIPRKRLKILDIMNKKLFELKASKLKLISNKLSQQNLPRHQTSQGILHENGKTLKQMQIIKGKLQQKVNKENLPKPKILRQIFKKRPRKERLILPKHPQEEFSLKECSVILTKFSIAKDSNDTVFKTNAECSRLFQLNSSQTFIESTPKLQENRFKYFGLLNNSLQTKLCESHQESLTKQPETPLTPRPKRAHSHSCCKSSYPRLDLVRNTPVSRNTATLTEMEHHSSQTAIEDNWKYRTLSETSDDLPWKGLNYSSESPWKGWDNSEGSPWKGWDNSEGSPWKGWDTDINPALNVVKNAHNGLKSPHSKIQNSNSNVKSNEFQSHKRKLWSN